MALSRRLQEGPAGPSPIFLAGPALDPALSQLLGPVQGLGKDETRTSSCNFLWTLFVVLAVPDWRGYRRLCQVDHTDVTGPLHNERVNPVSGGFQGDFF